MRERCGLELEILSGEEEARLAYLAAAEALGPAAGTRLVFDSGGGSSQFTFGHGDGVDERFSVDVGAVRMTERYGLDGVVAPERAGRRARRRSPATSGACATARRRRPSPAWAARSRTSPPSSTA